MKNLIILMLLLTQVSCYFPIPMVPEIEPGCRQFFATTWADEKSPWNDLDWSKVKWIDEPMETFWGWDGNPDDPVQFCGPNGLEKVEAQVKDLQAQGYTVWLNWTTEGYARVFNYCGQARMAGGADVVSFDDYGGFWDWNIRTQYRLDHMYRNLPPNTKMGLIPQGHYLPTWGVGGREVDRIDINALYFDWALRHQNGGKIFAFAPFTWGPCKGTDPSDPNLLCIADQPMLVATIKHWVEINPMCAPPYNQVYAR